MSAKKTNLFIVGAAKCGTTSLYQYLKQHPDIYFPDNNLFPEAVHNIKEPKYFSKKYHVYPHKGPGDKNVDKKIIKNYSDYISYYSKCKNEKYLGDASADYLYYYKTADEIYNYNNKAKIIILLRNPIERTYSAYTHLRRDYREKLSFEEALNKEEERMLANFEFIWGYKSCSLYYGSVKYYLKRFGRENVHVIIFDAMIKDVNGTLNKVCEFLGIERYAFKNLDVMYNKSGIPKKSVKVIIYNKFIKNKNRARLFISNIIGTTQKQRIVSFLRNNLFLSQLQKKQMNRKIRKYLFEYFKTDILKLQGLLNIDLSIWIDDSQ